LPVPPLQERENMLKELRGNWADFNKKPKAKVKPVEAVR
jgi:hypothetical protein